MPHCFLSIRQKTAPQPVTPRQWYRANIPTASRPGPSPRGQLMMPSHWNPQSRPALPPGKGALHACPAPATKRQDALPNGQLLLFTAASACSKPSPSCKPLLERTSHSASYLSHGAPALLGRETDEPFINHLVKS